MAIKNTEVKKYLEVRKEYLRVLNHYKSHSENRKEFRTIKRFVLGIVWVTALITASITRAKYSFSVRPASSA